MATQVNRVFEQNQSPGECSTCERNVSETERWISLVGGAALLAEGLTSLSARGLVTAALGGGLVYRGFTGHCNLYQAIGMNTAEPALAKR